MQLTPLLISILLFVSSKLKPLQPGYQKLTKSLISIHQPIHNLRNKVDQKKQFITSLPSMHYQNLSLQAENNQLKTQNLLLKNQLDLSNYSNPNWHTVPVRIIRVDQMITATSSQTDQIKPGMPLIHSTNLIGIVQKISPPIIHILPLTHKNTTFPIQISPNIKGDYAFQKQTPQMINITNQVIPNQKETIFTLPTKQIPEGLIIGQVGQTITRPSNPIQKIEINLTTDPNQLPSAHIITQP